MSGKNYIKKMINMIFSIVTLSEWDQGTQWERNTGSCKLSVMLGGGQWCSVAQK